MEAELEGVLLIRTRPFPDRYCKLNGLEVKKIRGQAMDRQVCSSTGRIEEHRIRKGVSLYALLPGIEQIVGHVFEVGHALRGEFSRFGADVRQPVNRVFWFGFVSAAIVIKAACKRRVAMRPYFDDRLGWTGADALRLVNPGFDFFCS